MAPQLRRIVVVLSMITVLSFSAGTVLAACDGNYCPDFDTSNCVALDVTTQDNCCLDLDSTGTKCWTCTRQGFECLEGNEVIDTWGPGYDCTNPGSACN